MAALITGLTTISAHGQDGSVTFDVGEPQGIDSMSPLIGVVVPSFEAWNIQYATLTDKAAEDFHTIPGLAESWTASKDKLTWTYKLRDGLKWSDGKPLTSEDIAWNVNTSRKEEWLNHSAVTANLTATAPDPQTVVIKTSVPDPKLPTMDVYILPKHIWGKLSPDERDKYAGEDGVGSGPFVLDKFEKGQFARFKANPNYWGGKPAVDTVVLRKFNNPDAMVAALKTGELDAAWDIPGAAFNQLKNDDDFVTNEGYQGSFSEVALNGGDGLKKGHPALEDPEVRKAIAHAIDRDTLVARVLDGIGKPLKTISPSANPEWVPDLSEDTSLDFDLDEAKRILEDAGYKDTNGDGVREMPNGGEPLKFTYYARSDGETGPKVAEFVRGWLDEIGIATTEKIASDSELTPIIGKGDYDMFAWGWTPYVDPDTMLDYMTCKQVAADPDDPTNYYNDANYCDPEYDKLYAQQKVELDPEKRKEIVHEMLTRWAHSGVYNVMWEEPETIAYRKDRFEGWTQQPAETGPVLFSNTSPTYAKLKPVSASASGDDDGGGSGGIIAIIAAAVLVLGGGAWFLSRRRSADERE
ncbi:MAG: ABC transporter substrate-binding protein [Thermoleophilaceae bacterium]|nr:ABC transporter substrate-binding protein [Thermoleophilaceae bacterium]